MRILIVDAEPLNRFLLLHMLKQEGYLDVVEAETGEEALNIAHSSPPDLVLVDVILPDMSSEVLIPKIKAIAGSLYLPVIFITSQTERSVRLKCFDVGGDDFVSKPFDQLILATKIRSHARTRQLSLKLEKQNQMLMSHQLDIDREHAIVEHIFENALQMPKHAENLMQYHIAPASNFNGDLFLLNTSVLGSLYFLIGDFTGHGLASAIGALPAAKAFMATSHKGIPVEEIAATLNTTLLDLLPGDMFFACIIGEIAQDGLKMRIWNGGMPPLLLLSDDGKLRHTFSSKHMSLGILDREDFEADVSLYTAEEGDRLFGFTDGVIELENSAGKMLGIEGLTRWLQKEPDICIDKLVTRLDIFRGPAEQEDDVTLFAYDCGQLDIDVVEPKPQLPWKYAVTARAEHIRQLNPVMNILESLQCHNELHRYSGYLFTILSELYNNALEHGLLGLDSSIKDTDDGFIEYYDQREAAISALAEGQIEIELEFSPEARVIYIRVKDSGQGFDVQGAGNKVESLEAAHGRGIELLRHMTGQVTFSASGTQVEVEYHLDS